MSDREFFIETLIDEKPRFERVFQALPADQLSWRPHPKSRSASEIVTSMAIESATFLLFLESGEIDFSSKLLPQPANFEQAVGQFLKGFEQGQSWAQKMNDAAWDETAKMMSGEKVDWETTKGKMAWGLLLDLIHHRGQLSVYIRPMGGKVPAIYGPSGDSNS